MHKFTPSETEKFVEATRSAAKDEVKDMDWVCPADKYDPKKTERKLSDYKNKPADFILDVCKQAGIEPPMHDFIEEWAKRMKKSIDRLYFPRVSTRELYETPRPYDRKLRAIGLIDSVSSTGFVYSRRIGKKTALEEVLKKTANSMNVYCHDDLGKTTRRYAHETGNGGFRPGELYFFDRPYFENQTLLNASLDALKDQQIGIMSAMKECVDYDASIFADRPPYVYELSTPLLAVRNL